MARHFQAANGGYTRDAAIRPNRGQHTSGEPSRAEGSKTPSQAALVPYGSDRVNRDPLKKGLAASHPGGNTMLLI